MFPQSEVVQVKFPNCALKYHFPTQKGLRGLVGAPRGPSDTRTAGADFGVKKGDFEVFLSKSFPKFIARRLRAPQNAQ